MADVAYALRICRCHRAELYLSLYEDMGRCHGAVMRAFVQEHEKAVHENPTALDRPSAPSCCWCSPVLPVSATQQRPRHARRVLHGVLSRLSEDRVLPAGMVGSAAAVCRCIDTSSSLLTTTSASGFEAALMQGAVQVDIVRLCSRRYIWA